MFSPRTTLISILGMLLLLSCRTPSTSESTIMDASDNLVPLPKKTQRIAMCGVDRYKARAHSSCGAKTYKAKRSSACGVEKYNSKSDPSCPGFVPGDSYTDSRRECGSEPSLSCRSGYNKTEDDLDSAGGCGSRGDREPAYKRTIKCVKPAVIKSCRKREWGVETYKSCRHSSHGVQTWKTCRKSAFGIERYKSCSFYLLPDQVTTYLQTEQPKIPMMGELLVNHKAMYFSFANDEPAMACHIKKYDGDPLLRRQMNELKVIYESKFYQTWEADRFDCNAISPSNIDSESCPDSDASTLCRAVRSYRMTKKWLDITRTNLTNLKGDIPASKDAALKRKIQSVLTETNKYK